MDPSNTLCNHCDALQQLWGKTAEFFCSCTNPETFLCSACLHKHISRMPKKGHRHWPIALLPNYKKDSCLKRLEAFPRVSEEALGCVGQIDTAITELTAKVEEIKATLTALCTEKVRELQDIKANLTKEISFALAEVKRTLLEEQPLLLTYFGPLIRKHIGKTDPLQLFTFTIEAPETLLSVHIQLANSQDNKPAQLAGMYHNGAFLYDVESHQFTRHTLSVDFGNGGSYAMLDRNRLLCLGAHPPSSAVYLLELPSFQLNPLPSLSTPRSGAGVANVNAYIYAFGGWDNHSRLRSCEKMDLSSKCWTHCGDMTHPRSSFTPCLHRSLLYLAAASTPDVWEIETFDPETETFAVLPVSLPPELTLKQASVAFIANEELCLLTCGRQLARWKIDTESEFRLSWGESIWSNQQPLIVGPVVLIACRGGVVHFSLKIYYQVNLMY